MDKLVFSCFVLGGLTPNPGPTDTCALNAYCPTGVTNVGCNPPPATGGSACDGESALAIDLQAAEQNQILSYLNQKRNEFASGQDGNAKANRMFKLQWDASLATQAGNNARSCNTVRDNCRNTKDYANVGQMIPYYYNMISVMPPLTVAQKIDTVLNGISFSDYAPPATIASLSSYSASSNTEDQANILNDRSTKVGCALMQWDLGGFLRYFYLVCDFSANVIEGQPLFTTAATAGAGCATKDTTYTSLCLT